MSDASKAPGDPVEDPRPADEDVVGRAHEGLASAEAAQRDIDRAPVADTARAADARADEDDAAFAARYAGYDTASDTSDAPATSHTSPAAPKTDAAPAAATAAYASSTTAYDAPAPVTSPEPAAETVAAAPATSPASPQPIFVQAPEAPRPRGNRAAAGLIGLLAALSFAVLYLAVALGLGLLDGTYTFDSVLEGAIAGATSWWLWITTATYFVGFWLLGAIINRGRWGHWVVWGLLLGFVAYGAHLVGQLFEAPFWQLTRTEGAELVEAQLVAPLAFAAFVIGRELAIWYGAWISARGRRVSELNNEAQREYERTLEAGPTLVRS
jgi:hypothetical protein